MRSGCKCTKSKKMSRGREGRCKICGEQVTFIEQSLSISFAFLFSKMMVNECKRMFSNGQRRWSGVLLPI
jgi:hypothetical protein